MSSSPSLLSSSAILAVFLLIYGCLYALVSVTNATFVHESITRYYKFEIKLKNVTRLCHTRKMVTVNGKFPGPRVVAREGDRMIIKVVNHSPINITLHWHGIRQLRSGWADGPAYVTQCPIQPGQTYVHNFTIFGQKGTLFWHAHYSWLRDSVYGPLIVLPRHNASYPFRKPYKEVTIMFGEWFNSDPILIIKKALRTGDGPEVSEAYTFNGLPGPLYNCSAKDTYRLKVKPGKTYLLRLINAAMNDELFFSIANHSLKIVEADATYIKPFKTKILVISPGQTTNVLLKTKRHPQNATFLMLVRPYFTGLGTFDNSTAAAILEYQSSQYTPIKKRPLFRPKLPALGDSCFVSNFTSKFRSLASAKFPANVPKKVDKKFFFTIGIGTIPCPKNHVCHGAYGAKFAAAVNNISFVLPKIALLQAHYFNQYRGVYTPDFPEYPPYPYNFTGQEPNNTMVTKATKTLEVPFNTSVELVLQGTCTLGTESHPVHLHGYNFFIVGKGFGNYDPEKDPANFNLIDPVERNTVAVPAGGWVVIRFLADNPGVWLMHCHYETHMSWGLQMTWTVLDGELPHQKLPPPPSDLPKC